MRAEIQGYCAQIVHWFMFNYYYDVRTKLCRVLRLLSLNEKMSSSILSRITPVSAQVFFKNNAFKLYAFFVVSLMLFDVMSNRNPMFVLHLI